MRYPDRMDRPLSDDDRRWLVENNMGDVAAQFDAEDGVENDDLQSAAEPVDYSKMTVDELKSEIDRRNVEILEDDPDAEPISQDGKKRDLIKRLQEDDEEVARTAR